MKLVNRQLASIICLCAIFACGCGKKEIEYGMVEGVVRVSGQPQRG